MDSFKRTSKDNRALLLCLIIGIIAFVVGILIGYFARDVCTKEPCIGPGVSYNIVSEADESITQKIIDAIDADNIRDNLRYFLIKLFKQLKGTYYFIDRS